jgi:hypothetical protein
MSRFLRAGCDLVWNIRTVPQDGDGEAKGEFMIENTKEAGN